MIACDYVLTSLDQLMWLTWRSRRVFNHLLIGAGEAADQSARWDPVKTHRPALPLLHPAPVTHRTRVCASVYVCVCVCVCVCMCVCVCLNVYAYVHAHIERYA